MPCLIAFSTSGCTIERRIGISSISRGMPMKVVRRILEAFELDLEIALDQLPRSRPRDVNSPSDRRTDRRSVVSRSNVFRARGGAV